MQNPKFVISNPNPRTATMIGGPPCLPLELISDMLSRLPSKILCRFKCVSKDFLFLISSDSQFKDFHRGRFSENPRLLQYEISISDGLESKFKLSQTTFDLTSGQECDKFDLEVSKSPKQSAFIKVIFCRELVCIYSDWQIMVLNPTTHQFISLSINNEILPNSVGIGYVDSFKEYKVVLINRTINGLVHHDLGCQVYTVKDGSDGYTVSTKMFEGTPQDSFYNAGWFELLPVCVDGVLYWMSNAYPVTRKMVTYYLNLKDNSYGNFPFIERDKVENDETGAFMAKFAELQGSLCIQCSSLRSKGFLVYALKDTKLGLWEEVYNIPYPPGIESRILSHEERLIAFAESISYRPAMSLLVPHVLGFLPSNHSGNGVPDFVVSEYIVDETCRIHIVENGTIKTSADIRFSPRKTCQLLYYEGLFSFKSS